MFQVKILSDEKEFLIFRQLPRNKKNEIEKTQIPNYTNWDFPKGIFINVIAKGKLMKGMRIEEVVLVAGPPNRISEHSGVGGTYWRASHPEVGSIQFSSSKKDLILETTIK